MSKVLVDREMLERCVDRWACCAIVETPGAEQAWLELRAVVKAAQPAEAEGVEAVEFWVLFDATTPEPYIKKMMPEGFLAFFDHEEDAIRAKSFHPGTDYKRVPYVRQSAHIAALSAVTAERDRLRDQVKVLQSDANSWQSGYDKGRHDGTKHRQSEVVQLRAEVEALRKDSERLDRLDMECEAYGFEGIHEGNRWMIDGPFRAVRDAIDAAMAAKEA